MKTRVLIVIALAFSSIGFSQKNEIKAAEKALKGGDTPAAKAALESASSLIDGADARIQAQYYAIKGNVYADLAKKGDDAAFQTAIDAYNKVISIEESSGKEKYTTVATQSLAQITADLVNAAVEDNGNKEFEAAADKLYLSYKLSPTDTLYLYYAASSAVNGQHYEKALGYYNELKEIGYDGSGVSYTAVNVQIRANAAGQVIVQGLKVVTVKSSKHLQDLLEMGSVRRSTGSTDMNQHSSRSHAIFTIYVEQHPHRSSK